MFIIKVEHSFDSAHFLAGYIGKCANIHGHRWKVEVEVAAEEIVKEGQNKGMIVDFSVLKDDIRLILDYYDHSLIIEDGTLREETLKCLNQEGFRVIKVQFRPTAENFASFFYNTISEKGYQVKKVAVYETPTNYAAYEKHEVTR